MAKDGGTRNTELYKRFMEKVCLGFRSPDRAPWAIAVTEARPVKNDDTISSGGTMDQTATRKILDHASIAVQQDQGFAIALLDVVEAHAFNLNEFSHGRIITFSLFGGVAIHKRGDCEYGDRHCRTRSNRVQLGVQT